MIAASLGNTELLRLHKTAFLCSLKIPASVVLKCYDWTEREDGRDGFVHAKQESRNRKGICNMITYVIDACTLIAYLFDEEGSGHNHRFGHFTKGERFFAPTGGQNEMMFSHWPKR